MDNTGLEHRRQGILDLLPYPATAVSFYRCSLSLWDTSTHARLGPVLDHPQHPKLYSLALSSDNNFAATSSTDGESLYTISPVSSLRLIVLAMGVLSFHDHPVLLFHDHPPVLHHRPTPTLHHRLTPVLRQTLALYDPLTPLFQGVSLMGLTASRATNY